MAVKTLSTPSTSFPARTFAKLSPHSFLHATLTNPTPSRPSGRRPSQARAPTCHPSSLSHSCGSAVVRLGDTSVVCGVRAEILLLRDIADYRAPRPSPQRETSRNDHNSDGEEDRRKKRRTKQKRRDDTDQMARLNLLVPNLELATGCSPAHLPGGPPSPLAQVLTQRILTLLHTSQLLDMDDLRICHHPPPASATSEEAEKMDTDDDDDDDDDRGSHPSAPELKAFWTIYMDMVFISLDGNPFDAAWGSVLAALHDVRLPRAYWDEDRDCVLCDPDAAVARPLTLYALPVATSFGVFAAAAASSSASVAASEKEGGNATISTNTTTGKRWVLVDMDGFEEGLCAEEGTVVVDMGVENEHMIRFEKSGGTDIGVPEMKEMVRVASKRWTEWRDVLGKARYREKGGQGRDRVVEERQG